MSNINVNNITPVTGTKVSVSGSLHASGDITAHGNITLGDAATDSINFTAEVSSSIIPDANKVYDLGSGSKMWKTVHAEEGSFTSVTASGDISASGNLYGNGSGLTFTNLTATNITAVSGTISYISSSSPTVFAGAIEPDSDNQHDIGSSTKAWNDFWADGTSYMSTASFQLLSSSFGNHMFHDINVSNHWVPYRVDTYDLGNTTYKWNNLYANTVHATTGSFSNITGSITFSNNVTFQNITATTGTISYISSSSPTVFAGNILPDLDDANDIGSAASQWKDLYIDGTGYIDSGSIDVLTVNSYVSSSLSPAQAERHDLGGSQRQWSNLYVNTVQAGKSGGTGAVNVYSDVTASVRTSASLSDIRFENLPTFPPQEIGSLWIDTTVTNGKLTSVGGGRSISSSRVMVVTEKFGY